MTLPAGQCHVTHVTYFIVVSTLLLHTTCGIPSHSSKTSVEDLVIAKVSILETSVKLVASHYQYDSSFHKT